MIDRNAYANKLIGKDLDMKVSDVDFPEDNRPVCLLIGINAPSFPAIGMLNGIRECGFRSEFLDWQNIKREERMEGLADRAIVKAKMIKPDLIICQIQSPESMEPKTFKALQSIAPVVNLTVDCREDEKTMQWYMDIAPLISLTCFSNQEDVVTCKKRRIRNTVSLHSSCDYNFYSPAEKEYKKNIALPRIVFVGTNYAISNVNFPLAKERQGMVDFLYQNYSDMFMAAGMGQRVSKYVNDYEELSIYRNADIIIGHNNFLRTNYSSDRMFRAMGSGAFFISSYFPGIETMFKKEIEIEWWDGLESLKNLIDYYLEFEEERKSIALAGCKLVRSTHRWKDRIQSIVDSLKIKEHE